MGKGSLSNVSPVMREWRDARKGVVVLDMPDELRKTVESSMTQVWKIASKMATTAVENIRVEAEARVEVVEKERDEALGEVARLEAIIASQEKTLAGNEELIGQTSAALDKERTHNSKLTAENSILTARLADQSKQAESLKAELAEARCGNKELQSELVEIIKKGKG